MSHPSLSIPITFDISPVERALASFFAFFFLPDQIRSFMCFSSHPDQQSSKNSTTPAYRPKHDVDYK